MTDAPPRNTENEPFPPRALDPAEVCTLEAASMAERLDWIRTEILPHAVETRRLADGLALELGIAPGLSEKLGRLIALERDCCGGIGFERARSASSERLRLEIHGVDPDAPLFRSLRLPAPDPASGRRRLAQALGAGAAASLLVCCVLPSAAIALLGAAAAPLAGLDHPAAIAGAAGLGGAGAWVWLGRRGRNRAEPADADACCPGC